MKWWTIRTRLIKVSLGPFPSEQGSTGALHLNYSSPYRHIKRKTTPKGVVFFLVDDIGLEPMTFRTSSGCSSQLS